MFGRTTTHRHLLWIEIETPLGRVQHRLVLPAFDAAHLCSVVHCAFNGQASQAVVQ